MVDGPSMTPILPDRDWRILLREIHGKRVIPVVGPRVVTVDDAATGTTVPLYRHLAPRLARELGIDSPDTFTSLDQVARSFLSCNGNSRRELYLALGEMLETGLGVAIPQPLRHLASITDFNLFVTSTPDPLLARAMQAIRPGFSAARDVIRFCPPGTASRTSQASCDLPVEFRDTLVYHILGDYTLSDFAIWEEDYMEFICGLLEQRGTVENLFHMFVSRSLLLLGAPSDDWIVRFFLRVVRGQRLSTFPESRDYLVESKNALSDALIFFFDKATKTTRVILAAPDVFVAELARRWRDTYGATDDARFLERQPTDMPPGSVFISYAREDLATAIRVGQALASAGVRIWLDRQRLRVGDNYENTLEQAVKDASFFISLISQHTEENPDRYVHKERTWAAQRHVDGYVFYLPLIIDGTEGVAREPQCFTKREYERLSDATLPGFVARARQLLELFDVSGRPRG
jgi:hypothetical protein